MPLLRIAAVVRVNLHVGTRFGRCVEHIEIGTLVVRKRKLVGAVSVRALARAEDERLGDGAIRRPRAHIRARGADSVGDVEREARKLGDERHRAVRRTRDLPLLGIVAERRALPHVRARSAPAVGHIEHLAGRYRGNRVVALAHRLDAPPLEKRAVRGGELNVRTRVELRACRGEHGLRVRSSRNHVHAFEGLFTCGFPFACSAALACSGGLRGLGLCSIGHGRRDGTGTIRLRRRCDLG